MRQFNIRTIFALVCVTSTTPTFAQPCVGDIAIDGRIDGGDLGVMLANWGPVTSTALSRACDLDGNAIVNGADLGILLSAWGSCPGPSVPAWATLIEAQPDPAVVTDPALRADLASTGFAWRVRDTATQVEFVLVPPGAFMMGCTESLNGYCSPAEYPRHPVRLTNAFYIGRYEVTQAQWTATMGSNPSFFQGPSYPDANTRPVEQVSWNTIQNYLSATSTRLPSEAEWEYACRAGTTTAFNNGSSDDSTVGTVAWHGANSGNQTHPCGGKAANAFGLYDMAGNAWEWINDRFDGAYYAVSPSINPPGAPSGAECVVRGGSWGDITERLRSSYRGFGAPGFSNRLTGFRVARNP